MVVLEMMKMEWKSNKTIKCIMQDLSIYIHHQAYCPSITFSLLHCYLNRTTNHSPKIMSSTTILVNGVSITVNVVANASQVDSQISGLKSVISTHQKPIVGLDAEWKPNTAGSTNKLATLQLCVGSKCLILQLLHFDHIPNSLKNFLADLNITFVGVGIQEDVRKFKNDYGVDCRNVVELGPLAANVLGSPARGLSELALTVVGLEVEKPIDVTLSDWSARALSFEQIKYAAIDAYAAFLIGKKLMGGI